MAYSNSSNDRLTRFSEVIGLVKYVQDYNRKKSFKELGVQKDVTMIVI